MAQSEEFQTTFGMGFTGLEDPNSTQYNTYRIPDPYAPYPQDYVIDADGIVRYWGAKFEPHAVRSILDELVGADFSIGIEPDPLVGGQSATVGVIEATGETASYLVYSLAGPGSTYVPQLDVTLGLKSPVLAAPPATTNDHGITQWNSRVPSGVSGHTIWLQVAQPGRVSNVIESDVQ